MNALFGEVTVLGFIALVTFFMIKSGIFEKMSLLIYNDDMHMLHLFEDVHFGDWRCGTARARLSPGSVVAT